MRDDRFTSLEPKTAPADLYRFVIVTLDAHAAGPAQRVAARLTKDFPGLTISVHAAAEWAENPAALARARADVAQANIIVANLIFLEEHLTQILPQIQARRPHLDACVGIISDPQIVKLTKMGDLANASGFHATAIGGESVASGVGSQAFGWQANASGRTAVAVGHQANAAGLEATSVGKSTQAGGANATAVGSRANAAGISSVAIGNGAVTADGTTPSGAASTGTAVAIGNAARATAEDAVALGDLGRFKYSIQSDLVDSPNVFNPNKHIKKVVCKFTPKGVRDQLTKKMIYPMLENLKFHVMK